MTTARIPYRVRSAVHRDLLAVLGLYDPPVPSAAVDPRPDPLPASARQLAAWARMMATDDLTVYIAESDEHEVVGTTCLLVMPTLTNDCRPTAFIETMSVAAEHRRRGVGRLLIEHLLADARAAGCRKVQLLTHKRHATDGAHDFYRSLGFTAEAEGFRRYLEPVGMSWGLEGLSVDHLSRWTRSRHSD